MEIKGREPVSVIQVDSNVKSKIHFLTGEEAKLSATTGLLPEEKQITMLVMMTIQEETKEI